MLFFLKQDPVHLFANDCDGLQGKEKKYIPPFFVTMTYTSFKHQTS